MQNFYGIALRQNSDSLYVMKKAVSTILWHYTDMIDTEVHHHFCPKENPVSVNIKEITSLEKKNIQS